MIYELYDPINKVYFYVGQTNNLNRRYFLQHLRPSAEDQQTLKGFWVNWILEAGAYPSVVKLEHVPDPKDVLAREAYWIVKRLNDGYPLANASYSTCHYFGLEHMKGKLQARVNLVRWALNAPQNSFTRIVLARWGSVEKIRRLATRD